MVNHSWRELLAKISPQQKAYPTNESNLEVLAKTLEISLEELVAFNQSHGRHYRCFKIPKKNGGERLIFAPSLELKELQNALLSYLIKFPPHPAATAFHCGGSTIVNARQHLNQAIIAVVDIKDFFLSTHHNRISSFFKEQGWERENLVTLMKLCTYKNALPQGAPTSPCLSNIINKDLDEELYQLSNYSGATYTRYGDDLTFSWPTNSMDHNLKTAATRLLADVGYEISLEKGWKIYRAEEEPEIVGVILGANGKLRVPGRIYEKLYQLHKKDKKTPHILMQIKGYEAYIRGIDKDSILANFSKKCKSEKYVVEECQLEDYQKYEVVEDIKENIEQLYFDFDPDVPF